MKKFYTAFLAILSFGAFAQVQDEIVTDCNQVTQSIYGVLASGKVLLVASDGTDCSVCKNAAPGLQNWAAQNSAKIQVWGAMTKTYSSNNPTCQNVTNWVSTYNWTDIFTFIDSNKKWRKQGTPRYYVYDPKDSSEIYNGFSENAAFQAALAAAAGSVGMAEKKLNDFSVGLGQGKIIVGDLPTENLKVQLMSLTGKVLRIIDVSAETKNFEILTNSLVDGIYLVGLTNETGERAVKKILVR